MPTRARARTARSHRVRSGAGRVSGFCAICATTTAQHAFVSGRRRRWQWLGEPVGDLRYYSVCDTCEYQTDLTAAPPPQRHGGSES